MPWATCHRPLHAWGCREHTLGTRQTPWVESIWQTPGDVANQTSEMGGFSSCLTSHEFLRQSCWIQIAMWLWLPK